MAHVWKPPVTLVRTPNLSERDADPLYLIIHHTAGRYPGDLQRLRDAECKNRVSADFYVKRDGTILQLNPDLRKYKTWHTGKAIYQGKQDAKKTLNALSLGVECEHLVLTDKKGRITREDDWPKAQVAAVAHLAAWALQEFKWKLESHPFAGHASIALPKGRKMDPLNFPWDQFSEQVRGRLAGTVM